MYNLVKNTSAAEPSVNLIEILNLISNKFRRHLDQICSKHDSGDSRRFQDNLVYLNGCLYQSKENMMFQSVELNIRVILVSSML